METLMDNAAFQTFAACTAILVIKNFLSGTFTAITRVRSKKFLNPEDARVFAGGADPAERETDAVARALRINGMTVRTYLRSLRSGWSTCWSGRRPLERRSICGPSRACGFSIPWPTPWACSRGAPSAFPSVLRACWG